MAEALESRNTDPFTALREIYPAHHAPPSWPIMMRDTDLFKKSLESVRVYHDARADQMVVRQLVKGREPVNIAMNMLPDGSIPAHIAVMSDNVFRRFGYRQSRYRELMSRHALPPSFALYIYALFKGEGRACRARHVINLIGYAFDHVSQPDFKFFTQGDAARKGQQLRGRLTAMWLYMLRCARDVGVPTVVIAFVGGGAFSALFPREFGRYFEMVGGALLDALKLSSSYRPAAIEVMDAKSCPEFFEFVRARVGAQITVEATGRVPEIMFERGAESKLFVNAWDPHSIVGNGNAGDPSLDGYMGRNSNMAYASFFDTNPRVLSATNYHPVDLNGSVES